MSFQPLVPFTGYTGYLFLDRTIAVQEEAHAKNPENKRATEYFAENIGSITSAADLVADRKLLTVALGAFGLDEDIDSKFFIQRILGDGTTSDEALSNKLSDSRYSEFSKAFGFGEITPPKTIRPDFSDDIIAKYERAQFEIAVGEQNGDLRLALNTASAITEIAESNTSKDGKWFAIMGNAPLREVFEKALNLPSSFASLDIDTQLETFKERAASTFGSDSVDQFTDPEMQEDLIQKFLIRAELSNFQSASSGSIALTLLGA